MKKAKVSKYGQWKYPGEDTIIPNANGSITMQGVPYPVLGIDDRGNQKMMMPGGEYQFPGNSVYEIPMAKKGGTKKVKIKSLPKAQSGPNTTDPEKPYGSTKGIPSNPYQVINGQYVFTLPDNTTWSTSNRRQADSINAHLARGWGFTGERTTAGEPAWARIPKETTDPKKLTVEDAGTSNDPDVQKVIVNTPKGDVTKLQNLKTKKFIGYEVLGSPVNINNATGDPSVDFRKNFKAPIPLKPEDETLAAKDTNYRDGYYSFANMMGNKSPATLLPQHYAMYNEGIPYMNPDFKSALLQNRYSLPSGYSNDLQNQGYTFFPESGTWGIDINKQGPGEMGYKKFGGGLPKAQYGTQKDVERSWANSSHNSNMDIISRGNDTAPFLFGVNTDIIDTSNPNKWSWKNAPIPEPVTLDLNDPNYNKYKQWESVYNLDQQYMPWLVNRLNDPSIPLSEKSHGPNWLPGSNYNDAESLNLNEIYDSRFLEEPYIKNNYDLSLLNDGYNYGDVMNQTQYDFANEGLPIWAVTVDKDSTPRNRKFSYLHQFFETPPPAIYLKGKDLKPTTLPATDIQPQLQNMAPLADGSKVQRVTINTPQGDMVRVQDPKTKKFIRWENVSGEAVDFDDESVGDTSSDFPQIQKSKSRPSFEYGGSLPKAQTGTEAAGQASNRLARRQQWLSRNPRNAYYTDIDEFTRANQAEEDSLNAAGSTYWLDMRLNDQRSRPSSFHDPRSGINPNSPTNRFNPAPGRGSIANETIRPQRVRYETVVDSSNIPHTVRVNDYKWPETHAVYKEEIKPKMIEAKPFIIPQVDIQPQLGNIPELPIPKGSQKQRVLINTPQGDMIKVQDPKTKKFIRWEHTSGESVDFEKKPTGNATDDFPEMRRIATPPMAYGGVTKAQKLGDVKLDIPQQFQQAPNFMDVHVAMPKNSGSGDFTTHRVPSVYDAVKNGDFNHMEEALDKYFGYPQDRAFEYVDSRQEGDNDPSDNERHAAAGLFTQQAVKDKIGIPVIGDAAGWFAANAMGFGHELGTIVEDERPWGDKIKEGFEDLGNNLVGTTLGLFPGSQDEKLNVIHGLSVGNWLPDGVVADGGKNNLYLKDEQGNVNRDSPMDIYNRIFQKKQGGAIKQVKIKSLPKAQTGPGRGPGRGSGFLYGQPSTSNATYQDSLDVANQGQAVMDWYNSQGYYGGTDLSSDYVAVSARGERRTNYSGGQGSDLNFGRDDVNSGYNIHVPGSIGDAGLNLSNSMHNLVDRDNIAEWINPNQFRQYADQNLVILNDNAPKALYDTRIKPRTTLELRGMAPGYFSGNTDIVNAPIYEKWYSAPWVGLSEEDKRKRIQFGILDGTPYDGWDDPDLASRFPDLIGGGRGSGGTQTYDAETVKNAGLSGYEATQEGAAEYARNNWARKEAEKKKDPNPDTDVVHYMREVEGRSRGETTYENRKKIAEELGIDNYSGTAQQNIELIKRLKEQKSGKENVAETVVIPEREMRPQIISNTPAKEIDSERRAYPIKFTGDGATDKMIMQLYGPQGEFTDNGYIPLDDPKYNPYKTLMPKAIRDQQQVKKLGGFISKAQMGLRKAQSLGGLSNMMQQVGYKPTAVPPLAYQMESVGYKNPSLTPSVPLQMQSVGYKSVPEFDTFQELEKLGFKEPVSVYDEMGQFPEKLSEAFAPIDYGPFSIPEDYYTRLMHEENGINTGLRDGRFYQYPSHEKGTDTIGYGHKLTEEESKAGSFNKGLTKDEAIGLMRHDVDEHLTRAKEQFNEEHGSGSFDKLHPDLKVLALDFVYNGIPIKEFPNFFGAAKKYSTTKDTTAKKAAYDKMMQQYVRHDDKGVPLGSRNEYTKYVLENMKQTGGALTKAQSMGQFGDWRNMLDYKNAAPPAKQNLVGDVRKVARPTAVAESTKVPTQKLPANFKELKEEADANAAADRRMAEDEFVAKWDQVNGLTPRIPQPGDPDWHMPPPNDPAGLPSVPIFESLLMAPVALGEAGLTGLMDAIYGAASSSPLTQATVAGVRQLLNAAPKAVPWLNAGNALTYGFGVKGANTIMSGGVSEPWKHANSTGNPLDYADAVAKNLFTALEIAPFAGPIIKTGVEAAMPALRATGDFFNTVALQTPLRNAPKYNPWAWKPNVNSFYHRNPDVANIVNQETKMLQSWAQSPAGKAYTETNLSPQGLKFKRGAKTNMSFSKGTPLDGVYSTNKYPGPYLAEVSGETVPFRESVKGIPVSDVPGTFTGSYNVPARPISVAETNFYKEHWLHGYTPIPAPTLFDEMMSTAAPKGNMYGQNQVLTQRARLLDPAVKKKFFANQAPEPEVPASMFTKSPKDLGNRITPENYEDFVNRIHGSTGYELAVAPKTGNNLGIGSYGNQGIVYRDAPLNNLGKDIINAHEKNHGIFAGTLSPEMETALLKPFGTRKPIPNYADKHQADEVFGRMGQFKNAVGIGDNQTFTLGHLNLIRKNYANQFIDNSIKEMLAKIKPGSAGEREFLINMNKFAFGLTGAGLTGFGIYNAQPLEQPIEQNKQGGSKKKQPGFQVLTDANGKYVFVKT